jgi:hypothetical protein
MCRTQESDFSPLCSKRQTKNNGIQNHILQRTISDIRFAVFHIQEESFRSKMAKPQVQDIHIQEEASNVK